MKPNFPPLAYWKIVLRYFFPQKTSYVEENFTYIRQTRKCLLSPRIGKRQPAKVENGGKIMVTWSLLPFAFHVNVMPRENKIHIFEPMCNCFVFIKTGVFKRKGTLFSV